MRIVKDAEQRKDEILTAAERLFASRGFDATSTNDILDAVGIARGTLYYHFKSKEEILDGIIARIVDDCACKAAAVAYDRSFPVLERLRRTLMAVHLEGSAAGFVMEQIHKPQNALMHQKTQAKLAEKINPIITDILKDGIQESLFQTDYPEETVEMVMLYANTVFDDLQELSPELRPRKVAAFIYNLERLMHAAPGSLAQVLGPLF